MLAERHSSDWLPAALFPPENMNSAYEWIIPALFLVRVLFNFLQNSKPLSVLSFRGRLFFDLFSPRPKWVPGFLSRSCSVKWRRSFWTTWKWRCKNWTLLLWPHLLPCLFRNLYLIWPTSCIFSIFSPAITLLLITPWSAPSWGQRSERAAILCRSICACQRRSVD